MPYVVKGSTVYKKVGKKLKKKAKAKSKMSAKKMVKLLYAVEGGYELRANKPNGSKKKKKR